MPRTASWPARGRSHSSIWAAGTNRSRRRMSSASRKRLYPLYCDVARTNGWSPIDLRLAVEHLIGSHTAHAYACKPPGSVVSRDTLTSLVHRMFRVSPSAVEWQTTIRALAAGPASDRRPSFGHADDVRGEGVGVRR